MDKNEKKGKQPLMSGIDIMRAIESIIIVALIATGFCSLWAVIFKGALHQLIICVPCMILAATLIYHQIKDKDEKVDA